VGLPWWYISIIPATWETEVGGSWPEASPCKSEGPYLKNKLKSKRAGDMDQ
jgi:hypothetical protein